MSARVRSLAGLAVVSVAGGMEFPVQAVAGSSRERVIGLHGDALRIAVVAPPENGRANDALARILAALGTRPSEVAIVSGHASRRKGVRAHVPSPDAARERLECSICRNDRGRKTWPA